MAINQYLRYPTKTDAPSPAYPYGSARNISVPGDGTGTPWEQAIVNDLWGWMQQLLDAASIVPTNSPDEVGASQYFTAMRATAGFPGLIVPMMLNADPATFGLRILLLDGSGVLRASYPDLDAAVYVGDSLNPSKDGFYHADDAAGTSRNTAGAYLILGDFRGYFLRGTGGIDPQVGRTRAGTQGDALENHFHEIRSYAGTRFREIEFSGLSKGTGRVLHSMAELGDTENIGYAQSVVGTDFAGISVSTSSETRPSNWAVDYGIWY